MLIFNILDLFHNFLLQIYVIFMYFVLHSTDIYICLTFESIEKGCTILGRTLPFWCYCDGIFFCNIFRLLRIYVNEIK